MISAGLQPDLDVLRAVRDHAGASPKLMRTAAMRQIRRVASTIRKDLRSSEPAAVPDLPFIWSYHPDTQRRVRAWYFINKVPRNSSPGGRYERRGELIESYEVSADLDDLEGVITLSNDAAGAPYTIGDAQVPSHYLTGWEPIDETAERYRPMLTERLIDTWLVVSVPEI